MKKLADILETPGVSSLSLRGQLPGEDGGAFALTSDTDRRMMRVIASWGMGWDHVSVSRTDRCPIWEEMEQVKRAFFLETEDAMQLHVPPSDHVNMHPYCLHLWRPQRIPIPRPPSIMVGTQPSSPPRAGSAKRTTR